MYIAKESRYDHMIYNRCGLSGLKLPAVSLGLWHNFGSTSQFSNMREMCFTAFDNGITHFDLANNYGPEPGSAESNSVRSLKKILSLTETNLLFLPKPDMICGRVLMVTSEAESTF